MTLYQSDVRTLTDEELEILSDEIVEAYQREDDDGYGYFTDSEAEYRYCAIQSEIQRRWEEANPEEAKYRREHPLKFQAEVLKILSDNAHAATLVNAQYDQEFMSGTQWPKIGDTITVRKPARFGV